MKAFWTVILLCLGQAAFAATNYIANPGFDQGTDGLDAWEAYDLPSGTVLDPAVFATVSGGAAAIRGYSEGETAFYQTYTVASGILPAGTYTWTAELSDVTEATATMFIKVWDADGFSGFKGDKYQNVLLTNGTMTLTYEHDASDLVQFGFASYSADTNEGFTVASPALILVAAGPNPVTLRIDKTSGSPAIVTFTSEANVSYMLEYTTDLAAVPVSWTAVDTQTGNGAVLALDDAAPTNVLRVYRVVTP